MATKKITSESRIHKGFRYLFQTLFLGYVLIVIGIGGCFIYGFFFDTNAYQIYINSRSGLFLLSLLVFIIAIIGSIFKLLRKRTMILPVSVAVITAICSGQVVF
ncbi:MAG: hypothetical protein SPL08_02660 [Pseudomonadota bacterium]|nr:hypothetical protein [Pseudomonadota bacterium]